MEWKVAITPVGSVAEQILHELSSRLRAAFLNLFCEVLAPLPLDEFKEAYDPRRGQYNSYDLLRHVYREELVPREYDKALLVTCVDLFTRDRDFVFGEAEFPGRLALLSLKRLDPRFYNEPFDWLLFAQRTYKEGLRLLVHTFGLPHCPRRDCVMSRSLTIADVDSKGDTLCSGCRKELAKRGLRAVY